MDTTLSTSLSRAIEKKIAEWTAAPAQIAKSLPGEGGSINHVHELRMVDGARWFVKANADAREDFFECEAEGLARLRETGAIRVPEVLGIGGGPEPEAGGCARFIVLEYIEAGDPPENFAVKFARALAELHKSHSKLHGLDRDNYIGANPQDNNPAETWLDFFTESRLGFQIHLLNTNGYATAELMGEIDKVMAALPSIIGEHEAAPSCLHGDLWAGNFICAASGEPVLIDPAVYFGDRETDLAMTELFGRFDTKFYGAYREAYPVASGYERRRDVYNLYHMLNHLNLFGLSYMGGVMEILRRLV